MSRDIHIISAEDMYQAMSREGLGYDPLSALQHKFDGSQSLSSQISCVFHRFLVTRCRLKLIHSVMALVCRQDSEQDVETVKTVELAFESLLRGGLTQ